MKDTKLYDPRISKFGLCFRMKPQASTRSQITSLAFMMVLLQPQKNAYNFSRI